MTKNSRGVECQIADPCRPCMHGASHPPMLAVYDEERGTYVAAAEHGCMARWASTNGDHAAGSICGLPVYRSAGEFDLCAHHYWRLINWRCWDKPREELKELTRELREADSEYAAAVRESEIHRERVRVAGSCVYYIRRVSDGMIKIGTTTEFRRRIATHRKEQGEIQILLTHSGGRKEENGGASARSMSTGPGAANGSTPTRPAAQMDPSARGQLGGTGRRRAST